MTPGARLGDEARRRARARWSNTVQPRGPAAQGEPRPGDVIAAVGGPPGARPTRLDARRSSRHDVGQSGRPRDHSRRKALRRERDARAAPRGADRAGPGAAAGRPAGRPRPERARHDAAAGRAGRLLGTRGSGVTVITDVSPGSAADRAGLKAGDIIVECRRQGRPDGRRTCRRPLRTGRSSCACSGEARSFYAALQK